MSKATNNTDETGEKTFKERCEEIANDEEISEDVRRMANVLLADIKSGDLDAN